jgi:hypothetical protein
MNDLLPGLMVTALAALLAGGIFYWTGRAKKARIEALRSLCSQRGWNYGYETDPLQQKHVIEGDGWVFAALSRSSAQETAPGSSSWAHETRWRSLEPDPGRGTFLLGSRRSGGMDLSQAPAWALSRLFGDGVSGLQALVDTREGLATRYVLFGRDKDRAHDLIPSRSEELLLAWPEALPLLVRSSPAELSLQVQGKRLEKTEDVGRFIKLAESFLKQ